jgi:hypothetical protein
MQEHVLNRGHFSRKVFIDKIKGPGKSDRGRIKSVNRERVALTIRNE